MYTDLDQYVCAGKVDFLFMMVEGTNNYSGRIKHGIFALFLLIVFSNIIKTNHQQHE
jgi:hypothetical protein